MFLNRTQRIREKQASFQARRNEIEKSLLELITSSNLNVVREVVYNHQQTPHSATVWTLISLFTGGFGLIWVVYYSLSPNHYWKA